MRKIFGTILVMMVFLLGCDNQIGDKTELQEVCPVSVTVNEAVDLLQLTMSDDQLVAIIHEPTEEQIEIANQLDVIDYEEAGGEDQLLIVPNHIGSKVMIYEVRFEEGELVEGMPLMEIGIIENHQILAIKCKEPEGIPLLKVVVEYKNQRVEYLITYDGLGGEQVKYF